jgi:hypothetical protein
MNRDYAAIAASKPQFSEKMLNTVSHETDKLQSRHFEADTSSCRRAHVFSDGAALARDPDAETTKALPSQGAVFFAELPQRTAIDGQKSWTTTNWVLRMRFANGPEVCRVLTATAVEVAQVPQRASNVADLGHLRVELTSTCCCAVRSKPRSG